MDINEPNSEGDLNSFERQLAEWRPDSKGLHPDRMLYTAGLAAGKRSRGRIAWPALALVLALSTALSLGWGFSERSENCELAHRIHDRSLPSVGSDRFAEAGSTYIPAANDYLHLRHRAEENLGDLLASSEQMPPQPLESAPIKSNILKAGQYDRWRDQ
jgi:hypothetical protein